MNLHVREGSVRNRARHREIVKSLSRSAVRVPEGAWSDFVHLISVVDEVPLQMMVDVANRNGVEHLVALNDRVDSFLAEVCVSDRLR